jgi:hypothetical protein
MQNKLILWPVLKDIYYNLKILSTIHVSVQKQYINVKKNLLKYLNSSKILETNLKIWYTDNRYVLAAIKASFYKFKIFQHFKTKSILYSVEIQSYICNFTTHKYIHILQIYTFLEYL